MYVLDGMLKNGFSSVTHQFPPICKKKKNFFSLCYDKCGSTTYPNSNFRCGLYITRPYGKFTNWIFMDSTDTYTIINLKKYIFCKYDRQSNTRKSISITRHLELEYVYTCTYLLNCNTSFLSG